VVQTDARWANPVCEDEKCKVEKCVEIRAPEQLFPEYNISTSKQCEMQAGNTSSNFTLCGEEAEVELRFDFKRRNEYARNLPLERKVEMQNRLLIIGFSLLAFNLVVFGVGLWNAMFYHGISLTGR